MLSVCVGVGVCLKFFGYFLSHIFFFWCNLSGLLPHLCADYSFISCTVPPRGVLSACCTLPARMLLLLPLPQLLLLLLWLLQWQAMLPPLRVFFWLLALFAEKATMPSLKSCGRIHTRPGKSAAGSRRQCSAACSRCRSRSCCCCCSSCVAWPPGVRLHGKVKRKGNQNGEQSEVIS